MAYVSQKYHEMLRLISLYRPNMKGVMNMLECNRAGHAMITYEDDNYISLESDMEVEL